MQLNEFDYCLPENLIAQEPLLDRAASRLLVLDRRSGQIEHRIFSDIVNYFRPGDAMVLNDTRVFAARVPASKVGTGGRVEFFFQNDPPVCLEILVLVGDAKSAIRDFLHLKILGRADNERGVLRIQLDRDLAGRHLRHPANRGEQEGKARHQASTFHAGTATSASSNRPP